jgi:hypothetical protein
MNKSVIYIVGATVLVGGAYLFLKNKKAKDLSTLAELGGATPSGATTGGTTLSLSTTSDGVAPSDANLNLTNATLLVGQRADLKKKINQKCGFADPKCINERNNAKTQLVEIDKKLATLGYKVDAIGQLVKI